MYLLQIKAVNFRSRPDEQTVTYTKRIPDWLSQWTVANNFHPYLMEGREPADLEQAMRLVVARFLEMLNSALPELVKRDPRSHAADFTFSYKVICVEVGKEGKAVSQGQFTGDEAFSVSEEAA
jgi:hypothetical protein